MIFRETKLNSKNCTPSLWPNYTLLSKDRPREGGGLLTAIHNPLLYDEQEKVEGGTLEAQSVNIKANIQNLRVMSFYIPHHSSCPKDYKAWISTLLSEENSIALGNANAHYPLRSSNIPENRRRANLGAKNIQPSFTPLKDHHQTRLSYDKKSSASSSDLSLTSFLVKLAWQTTFKRGSDHLPTFMNLPITEDILFAPHFNRADWKSFKNEMEDNQRNQRYCKKNLCS